MDKKLLTIIACPICKGPLQLLAEKKELLCRFDRMAYPIQDDIPVMIEQNARLVSSDELAEIPHR